MSKVVFIYALVSTQGEPRVEKLDERKWSPKMNIAIRHAMRKLTAVIFILAALAAPVLSQDVPLSRSKPKPKPPTAVPQTTPAPESQVAPAPAPAPKPLPSIKGHTLGEALVCPLSAMSPKVKKEWKGLLRGGMKVTEVRPACNPDGDWELPIPDDNPVILNGKNLSLPIGMLTYKAGKLVKISLHDLRSSEHHFQNPHNNNIIRLSTIQKFGEPTSQRDSAMMNAMGAHWNDEVLTWELPNAYITLYVWNNPADQSTNFEMMTPEEHTTDSKRPVAKNPLD